MDNTQAKAHSEEWFKGFRDFWWNADFLDLMARRLELGRCRKLLDIGCGQCHWSRLLVPFLQNPSEIHGIDIEPKWASGSDELNRFFTAHSASITIKQGDAHALPYETNSFDVVTCQTTLIHLHDPKAAIMEMHRVVKPGGLIFCAEPSNVVPSVLRSSLSVDDSIEATMKAVQYALVFERGKALLGEGDSSYGDILVRHFSEQGLRDIRVYLSDKANPVFPPYETAEQQAVLQASEEWDQENSGPADQDRNLRYFKAFGDKYIPLLLEMQDRSISDANKRRKAIQDQTYFDSGACLMYLVSGRKP